MKAKRTKKTEQLNFRCEPALKRRVLAEAEKQRRTVPMILEDAVTDYLQRQEKAA